MRRSTAHLSFLTAAGIPALASRHHPGGPPQVHSPPTAWPHAYDTPDSLGGGVLPKQLQDGCQHLGIDIWDVSSLQEAT